MTEKNGLRNHIELGDKMNFESAKTIVELFGLFAVLLPMTVAGLISLKGRYEKR